MSSEVYTSILFLRLAKPTHHRDDFELSTLKGSILSLTFAHLKYVRVFISLSDADISDFFGFMREHFTRMLRMRIDLSLTEANCLEKWSDYRVACGFAVMWRW